MAKVCKVFGRFLRCRCGRSTTEDEQHLHAFEASSSSSAVRPYVDDPSPGPPRLDDLSDSTTAASAATTTASSANRDLAISEQSRGVACTSPGPSRIGNSSRLNVEPTLKGKAVCEDAASADSKDTNDPTLDGYIADVQQAGVVQVCDGINVPSPEAAGTPVLHLAAQYPSAGPIRSLIRAGADVDDQDENGVTALHISALCDRSEVADALLTGGASLTIVAIDGSTPLHVAARSGSVAVVRLLLEAKAHIDTPDTAGGTALHCAAGADHVPVVESLLQYRADPCTLDNWHRSPLHAAAYSGSAKAANLLLRNGANHDNKDVLGETAMDMAAQLGHQSVVYELSNFNANNEQHLCDTLLVLESPSSDSESELQ